MNKPTQTVSPHSARAKQTFDSLREGDLVDDRYRIVRQLGSGGYGLVYLARDLNLKRDIALKLLRPDRVTGSSRIRLRREVQVARDVTCPQLVRVFDLGNDDHLTWITMELVQGETLREKLARGRLEIEEALRIAIEILRGLEQLHDNKIVHRDVKPGNVLLAEDGSVKLGDFGLARHWDRDETRATETSSLVGTVEYASPEQALGKKIGPRSDLYGLGVVLFEMLAGRLPHEGASDLGTLLAHIQKRARDVRQDRPEVPVWLASLIARLLERRPGDRPKSATQVIHMIESEGYWFPWSRARQAISVTLILLAIIPLIIRKRANEQVADVRRSPDGYLTATSEKGKVVWRKENAISAEVVRSHNNQFAEVYALFRNGPRIDVGDVDTLQILNISDGSLNRTLKLTTSPATTRLRFSKYLAGHLTISDFDQNGSDEIVIKIGHMTQWPNSVILYEPDFQRYRTLLTACGSQRLVGIFDFDNNESLETVLFIGTNNCLGWKTNLTAVHLQPALGSDRRGVINRSFIGPGEVPWEGAWSKNSWYILLPQTVVPTPDSVQIHQNERTIELARIANNGSELVTFEGVRLRTDTGATNSSLEDVLTIRQRAFREEHLAKRALDKGLLTNAALHIQECRDLADEIHADQLSEWCHLLQGRLFLAQGEVAKAELLFNTLLSRSEGPGDIAYEAAAAMHLGGYLEAAAEWYQFGINTPTDIGRLKFEFVFGRVLALLEMESYDEAHETIANSSAGHQPIAGPSYRAFIQWRRGESLDIPEGVDRRGVYDLFRYWNLEFRHYQGEKSGSLLADLTLEQKRASEEYIALVDALRADVDASNGRYNLSAIRQAYAQNIDDMHKHPVARAHHTLVAGRFIRMARAVGNESEAVKVETALAQWQAQQQKKHNVPIPIRPRAGQE